MYYIYRYIYHIHLHKRTFRHRACIQGEWHGGVLLPRGSECRGECLQNSRQRLMLGRAECPPVFVAGSQGPVHCIQNPLRVLIEWRMECPPFCCVRERILGNRASKKRGQSRPFSIKFAALDLPWVPPGPPLEGLGAPWAKEHKKRGQWHEKGNFLGEPFSSYFRLGTLPAPKNTLF